MTQTLAPRRPALDLLMRKASLLLLAGLAACATEGGEAITAAPVPVVSAPARLAERLPAQAAAFQRGATAPIQQPLPGVEVAYATAGRSAAGFVQVVRPPSEAPPDGPGSLVVQDEYQRALSEAQRGAGPHRRLRLLRESEQPPGAPLFRCAELEGTYGRTAVTSMTRCSLASNGRRGNPRPVRRRFHHMTSALNEAHSTSTQPSVMTMRSARPNCVPMWVCTPSSVARCRPPHSLDVLREIVRAVNWSR